MTSVIGVQSFKGSLRRSCNLLPILGENATQLTQMCGGHIDSTTLAPSPYLQLDGTPASIAKGFICPLGQVCQVPLFIDVLCALCSRSRRKEGILSVVWKASTLCTTRPSRLS